MSTCLVGHRCLHSAELPVSLTPQIACRWKTSSLPTGSYTTACVCRKRCWRMATPLRLAGAHVLCSGYSRNRFRVIYCTGLADEPLVCLAGQGARLWAGCQGRSPQRASTRFCLKRWHRVPASHRRALVRAQSPPNPPGTALAANAGQLAVRVQVHQPQHTQRAKEK